MKTTKLTLKQVLHMYGVSQAGLARELQIPLGTVTGWCNEHSVGTCSDYDKNLICYYLCNSHKVKNQLEVIDSVQSYLSNGGSVYLAKLITFGGIGTARRREERHALLAECVDIEYAHVFPSPFKRQVFMLPYEIWGNNISDDEIEKVKFKYEIDTIEDLCNKCLENNIKVLKRV